jgi:hypothetical protein
MGRLHRTAFAQPDEPPPADGVTGSRETHSPYSAIAALIPASIFSAAPARTCREMYESRPVPEAPRRTQPARAPLRQRSSASNGYDEETPPSLGLSE